MDFLDPRARRAHRRRLKLGYALMSVVIALGTMLVLYLAYGYDIDRKTGTLIQNGIVFVDSKPQGGRVFINGVQQNSRTDTRLVLPAGVYTIRIERDNYRHWERTFSLEGGEIERLVYPFLIPNQFDTTDIAQYDITPALATQSPDRRWLIVQRPGQTYQFDVFDLQNPGRDPASLTVPPGILSVPGAEATLAFVEWSTDNRHVLFRRDYNETFEFLMLDRENPSESINVNTLLGIKPVEISLKNKRPDQFYFLDAVPGTLRVADSRNRTISAPILREVIDYNTYGDDLVLFVTVEDTDEGKADFRILENNDVYTLKTVNQSDHYVLELSRFDGRYYYVTGTRGDNITYVYQNPLDVLKSDPAAHPTVFAAMRLDRPEFVSFSANTQFIGLQSGRHFLVIDLEDRNQYRTELQLSIPTSQKAEWMDGHRFIYTVNQQSYIMDFDGSNQQTLVTSRLMPGPFFDRDYDNVFTFEESKADGGKKALTRTIIED